MLNTIISALVALLFVACTSGNYRSANANTSAQKEVSKDWTQRRDEFVSASKTKLDSLDKRVTNLEKSGKLIDGDKSDKAKDDAEDIREDIADVKKELERDAKKADAEDWEKERMELQGDINELEQEVSEFSGLYRR